MLTPFQVAASSRTRVVDSETSDVWPPMIPAMPEGPLRSQTRTVSASKARSTPSSVVIFSPFRRSPDDQPALRHLIEVERVQRLRREQHHVVGDVDDVVDRPLARRGEPRLQPRRRGAKRHLGEHPGGEARTELRNLDGDRRVVRRLALAGGLGILLPRRLGQWSAAERVHLPRHPVDAEAIHPVRVDLELEDGLGNRQDLGKRSTGRQSLNRPVRPRSRRRGGATARLFRRRRRPAQAPPPRGSFRRR